jgi:hypothetical protein
MAVQFTRGSAASQGMDLMRRINEGSLKQNATSEELEKIRTEISENCEELLEIGARIRPLLIEGVQVGWVRGLHPAERKMLRRWVRDPNDYISLLLQHATSFSADDIEKMQAFEVRSLVEVVRKMGDYDLSLYPFLPAYVTTQSSESLWYSKGERLSAFESKIIDMPDGKKIKIMAPPAHAKAWASLCTYREQAKKRLEENMNSLFIVRPWAGKSADPIAGDLRRVGKQLETDAMEPWARLVYVKPKTNVNDGWGHPGDSVEDLRRELKGMIEGDKHERMMEAWAAQMQHEEKNRVKSLEEARKKKGITAPGITAETYEVLTEAEVRARQEALRKGQTPKQAPTVRRQEFEQDATTRQLDKVRKYR